MKTLSIDIETYSSVNLAKSGVYRYAESPDFEILLFGYSADGAPVKVVDLAAGETLPADVRFALTDPAVTKWAFNAQFERVCLSRYLGYPTERYLDPSSWHCTMVWVATLGLPLSLEGVGAVLGLEKQKLKEGKDLIRYFCTPSKTKDGTFIRHYPADAPEKWSLFKDYNLRDVETEMGIQQKLSKFPVSETEWRNYTLAGMKKADIEKVKAFLSTCDDKYRPSYGKVVESHPRQCIIIATVNGERGYLRDITGNRRFWIIKLHQKKQKKTWDFTPEYRAQFWAEAKEIWKSGEKLYLEGEILEAAEEAQQSAMEVDERVGMVEEYLNTKLPVDWAEMDLFQRRSFLQGSEFGMPDHKGIILRTEVSNAEIWCECFGKTLQELRPSDSYNIATLMAQIPGWKRTASIKRQPIYGRQRLYQYTRQD